MLDMPRRILRDLGTCLNVTVAVGHARPELPGQSRGHCAGIDRGRCRHVTVAVGYATPPHPSGGTWGRLGHLRGFPRGSHGEKCSLSEQKGGNEHQKGPFLDEIGQIWTKSKKFRSFITEKAIFCGRTDGQTDGDISALRAGVPRSSAHQNSISGTVSAHRGDRTPYRHPAPRSGPALL